MSNGADTYSINDRTMIEELHGLSSIISERREGINIDTGKDTAFEHPLDEDIIGETGLLSKLLTGNEEEISYTKAKEMDELWFRLIDKSIKCLRFFDRREPFISNPENQVISYGMDALRDYRERYTTFEALMYGANPYYRDHVFHVIRVWFIGVFVLVKGIGANGADKSGLVDHLSLDGDADFDGTINFFEYISMWTISALCHDLGYPLEKAEQILDKTKDMMRAFVPSPSVLSNFTFTGTQDNINDYILKFMSTKMKGMQSEDEGKTYYGRIQPKYYLKYAKSLERFQHGVLGAVILYKMLLFFLESDFNMNDDHVYSEEDARQFYIRREILRAMASHTCSDTYNVHIYTLPSLLFMCDELQEWGRKSWGELYAGVPASSVKLSLKAFSRDNVEIIETLDLGEMDDEESIASMIARIFKKQYSLYKTVFRDGQHTAKRDFDLRKTMRLGIPTHGAKKREVVIRYLIPSKNRSSFSVELQGFGNFEENLRGSVRSKLKGALYLADYEDGAAL